MTAPESLTRRERQVMDVVYELGEASAKQVREKLPNALSYSAVRAVLSRLLDRGHLKYRQIGPRYVYMAAQSKTKASQAALKRIVDMFFDGSPAHTMTALLGISAEQLTREELDELERAIAAAKESEG